MSLQLLGLTGDLHGTDGSAKALELGDDILIAPLDILYAADLALALGSQGSDHQCRAGPQIAGLDGRTGEMVHALHHSGLVVYLDAGAQALELIHTASLVHDDVIDEADTRRGAATANARWNNQVAILSGDYIFARAFTLIAEEGYDPYVSKRLADLVCNLSVGEIIQDHAVYQASRGVADYYERIQKKTADFLEICCELGAMVGGMDREEMKKLAEYGHCIGMAFQITDDLLDIEQTAETIGKPAGNDIRQGIVTLPVIRALETSPDAEELERIVTDMEMTDEMVERALEIVKATDGVDFAKAKADEYLARAKAALPEGLPDAIREAYEMVADFIGDRDF